MAGASGAAASGAAACGAAGSGAAGTPPPAELFEICARQIGIEALRIAREKRVPRLGRAEIFCCLESLLRGNIGGFAPGVAGAAGGASGPAGAAGTLPQAARRFALWLCGLRCAASRGWSTSAVAALCGERLRLPAAPVPLAEIAGLAAATKRAEVAAALSLADRWASLLEVEVSVVRRDELRVDRNR